MPSCSICIDELKQPVALPCGHVFCTECVFRAVNAIKPYATIHYCPTCRAPYTTVNIDPTLIPSHLRTHIIPSIRRLYLDEPNPNIDSSMNTPKAVSECARISAENAALRLNCGLWRRRAEVHAAATLGLLNVARIARDSAVQLKQEKDELERRYNVLKRKIDAEELFSSFSRPSPPSSSTSTSTTPERISRPAIQIHHSVRRATPSNIRITSAQTAQPVTCSAWTDIAKNLKEDVKLPPFKRRRIGTPSLPRLHDIDVDVLPASLSRRRTPVPSPIPCERPQSA
ncbi:hypothetical protein ARMGADRAFT_985669 [Armillaria gallica]|uniref:RING-type domain-containing protein n=1 Tax=Armillaria gallica TaxID=47427 RepID=A0A2H3EKX0_ARMGA|nr:hypothetical protein ARMGADRAFT_985669 [Armillaria gallica]